MFWLKACTRCHGDLHQIEDVGASYISCIQCGKVLTTEQEKLLGQAKQRAIAAKLGAASRLSVVA